MVLLGIPIQRHFRCLSGKRVVLTNSHAWAKRTAWPLGPVVHMGFPDVWKTLWTLVTWPPGFAVAVRLDQNMAKVSIELLMPLSLQVFSKPADVRLAV